VNGYLRVPLFALGLAVILLLVSFSFSGSITVYWNGEPCSSGTQYGFPMPFLYYMSRSSTSPPLTHSTSVCPTSSNVTPLKASLSNALDDYLFWFAISLPVVFGLNRLASIGTPEEEPEEQEAKKPEPSSSELVAT